MQNLFIIENKNKRTNDNIVLLSNKYYLELYDIFGKFFHKIFMESRIIPDAEIFSDVSPLIKKKYINNSKLLEQIFKGAGYNIFKELKLDVEDETIYTKNLDNMMDLINDKTQGRDWPAFFIIFREINKYFRNDTHVFSLGDSLDKFATFWNISQQDPRIADKKIIKRIPFSGSIFDNNDEGHIFFDESNKAKSEALFLKYIENNDEFKHLLSLLFKNEKVVIMDFGLHGRAFLTLIYLLKNLSEKDARFNFLNSRINNLTFMLVTFVVELSIEDILAKYRHYLERFGLSEFYNLENLKLFDVDILDFYHTNSDQLPIHYRCIPQYKVDKWQNKPTDIYYHNLLPNYHACNITKYQYFIYNYFFFINYVLPNINDYTKSFETIVEETQIFKREFYKISDRQYVEELLPEIVQKILDSFKEYTDKNCHVKRFSEGYDDTNPNDIKCKTLENDMKFYRFISNEYFRGFYEPEGHRNILDEVLTDLQSKIKSQYVIDEPQTALSLVKAASIPAQEESSLRPPQRLAIKAPPQRLAIEAPPQRLAIKAAPTDETKIKYLKYKQKYLKLKKNL